MTSAWQLWLLWGVAIGAGTGSMALVFGAIVANRWFETQRGLVTGIFSAANATGQLVFLPVIVALAAGPGWRAAALVVDGRDRAARAAGAAGPGRQPGRRGHHAVRRRRTGTRGAPPARVRAGDTGCGGGTPSRPGGWPSGRSGRARARECSGSWSRTFWICGWSTNGLIQTHLIPAAHDHGMPPGTAAGLLAVIGVFDIVGTVGSGWLTDRMDPRLLLFVYYWFRGMSLLVVPWLLGPVIQPPLWVFIVFYGLDWVATVPPTVALCRTHFGLERSGVVFGWVFASHMVGAGVAASFAGWVRESSGDYFGAWMTAGGLCLVAAFACLAIPKRVRS